MESLTPREVQARIRAGESLAEVIAAAGLEPERVEAFAGPVLAERAHITAAALAAPLRRAGETASARSLRQVVAERLLSLGLDIDNVEWDAWRRSDGRWIAAGRFEADGTEHAARFLYDHRNRFNQAENDEARWLIGDPGFRAAGSRYGRSAIDQDSEPTIDLTEPGTAPETVASASLGSPFAPPGAGNLAEPAAIPGWLDLPADFLADEAPQTGSRRSALDTLYDMISVIEEDSVRIYRGLREPLPGVEAEPLVPPDDSDEPDLGADDRLPGVDAVEPESESAAAPEALIEAPATPPRRRGGRRQRASVPSWDEIMFGGPPA
jgi:hypothetical protein